MEEHSILVIGYHITSRSSLVPTTPATMATPEKKKVALIELSAHLLRAKGSGLKGNGILG